MIFSSVTFLLAFLPIFLILYYVVPAAKKSYVLLAGSLFFYGYGEPQYIFLLIFSIFANYACGQAIDQETGVKKGRKIVLALGVLLNLTLLGFFKWAPEDFGLPLGISFFTFQSISYLVDVYRNEISGSDGIVQVACYICMFPQLVAGPIVNYQEVRDDLQGPKPTKKDFDAGLKDFVIGLSMKVLLADRLSILWHELSTVGFESLQTSVTWMGAISYSLQIYFDFFGYSMMAIGLGRMLGFSLPVNFDLPYMSRSIREFYRRWHMTLGRFFSKYVYIPLGGSRKGLPRTIVNLVIVWILTTLWHGVSINFMLWGMLLCLVIVIEKLVACVYHKQGDSMAVSVAKDEQKISDVSSVSTDVSNNTVSKKAIRLLGQIFQHAYVVFIIILSWVCFAIADLDSLLIYLERMFGMIPANNAAAHFFMREFTKFGPTIAIGIFACTPLARKLYHCGKDTLIGNIVLTGLFWLCVYYGITMGANTFLYFRF